MSDSEEPEVRQRFISEKPLEEHPSLSSNDADDETPDPETVEKSSDNEFDVEKSSDDEFSVARFKDTEAELDESAHSQEDEKAPLIAEERPKSESPSESPSPRVFRAVHAPPQRPSFINRQFSALRYFTIEMVEFILLFFTTLFNPLADDNAQIQQFNQRRAARQNANSGNIRYSAASRSPNSPFARGAPFPGCGPSS